MTVRLSMAGLALAGGRSSRFGSEKAAALLHGRSLLQTALARLDSACAMIAVSAAEDSQAFRIAGNLGVPVLTDPTGAPAGPLTGVCAGLAWARAGGAPFLATLPCDLPLAPADLFDRLAAALGEDDGAAVARTPDGPQPLCAVIRTSVQPALAEILARGDHPPVHGWLAGIHAREVVFTDAAGFLNIIPARISPGWRRWARPSVHPWI